MNKRKNVLFVFYKKKTKNIFGVKRKIGKIKKKMCSVWNKRCDKKKCHVENEKKGVSFMKNVCLNKGGSR